MSQDNRIVLVCSVCKSRNYNTEKNKKKLPKLEVNKYCGAECHKHTLHKEAK